MNDEERMLWRLDLEEERDAEIAALAAAGVSCSQSKAGDVLQLMDALADAEREKQRLAEEVKLLRLGFDEMHKSFMDCAREKGEIWRVAHSFMGERNIAQDALKAAEKRIGVSGGQ